MMYGTWPNKCAELGRWGRAHRNDGERGLALRVGHRREHRVGGYAGANQLHCRHAQEKKWIRRFRRLTQPGLRPEPKGVLRVEGYQQSERGSCVQPSHPATWRPPSDMPAGSLPCAKRCLPWTHKPLQWKHLWTDRVMIWKGFPVVESF